MKKIISLLLCVMMLVSVAACGQNGDGATTATTAGTTQGTTSGTTATTATTQNTTAATQGTTTSAVVTPTGVFDESNIVLSFGALSDIHITANGTDDSESKFRAALSQLKTQAAKHDKNGLDAVAIAGDIADRGKTTQVNLFAKIVKESGIENVMLATGNHDYYDDADAKLSDYLTAMGEDYFKNDVDRTMFDKGARHCVLNGYHFIFVEPTKYSSNCPYDADVLKWLDTTLKNITTEDPNAYVFFFTHPMIYKTCYGSELSGGSWYTTHLTETLSKYPQVVTFGGHLHFPINDERSIMQTAFTSLGCGSVRYLAIERGYSNMSSATVPKDAYRVSSGLLVQIDASGNLRVTRMDFSNKSTFKEAWELNYPTADGAHLEKYSADRKNDNKAPVLTGTPVFTADVSPATGIISGASLKVPAGTDDDLVHHYNVTVKNESTGKSDTYKFLSDFYRYPQTYGMAKTLTFPLSITEMGKYVIEVVAVDSWDAESGKITCEATVGTASGEITSELPPVYSDFEFTNETVTDTNGKFDITVTGAVVMNTPLTFAGNKKTVGAFMVADKGQYATVRFKDYTAATIGDFYNSATGFSVEALYINRAPNGSQGIVCGTQKPGGWGLAESSGKPYFFTYAGSGSISISAGKASSTAELNHVIGTVVYDSATNKTYSAVYLNGVLVNSGSYSGKVGVHTSESVATAFCFGADIDGKGGGGDFQMTDFVLADVKIYANALNYKQVETAYNNAVEFFKN